MLEYIDPFAPKAHAGSGEVEPEKNTSTHAVNGVPRGTIKEMMAWVGDDVERAHQAYEAEALDEHPRKTLFRQLEEKFVSEVFQHPQFGGPDGRGGLGGSGVPEQITADAGAGDRTDTSGLELNKGGQDPTPKSNVPSWQENQAGPGDLHEGTQPDGAKGGHDSTYGPGVPNKFVGEFEPQPNEVDRPEGVKDNATAGEGEAAEDNTGPYKQFI